MPRYKDEPPAVRVYTVCDESRFLSVLVFCSSFYKFVQCFIYINYLWQVFDSEECSIFGMR